jgi:hypothetical protein
VNITDLARKYEILVALRERHDRGEGIASRSELHALAREFPGALREIDRTPMEVLRQRLQQTQDVVHARCSEPPWMGAMVSWHTHMAAALFVKKQLRGEKKPTNTSSLALCTSVRTRYGVTLSVQDIASIAAPPDGRVAALVWKWESSRFHTDEPTLRSLIFPGAHGETSR